MKNKDYSITKKKAFVSADLVCRPMCESLISSYGKLCTQSNWIFRIKGLLSATFFSVHARKMKRSEVVFSFLLCLLAVSASPVQHRWEVVPDSEGSMHLVDLNSFENSVEPSYVPETDVVFLLFTRQNPTVGQVIRFNDPQSIANSNFNPSHPTRVIIHGWLGSRNDAVNLLVTAALLQSGNFNVN
jgi:Lipase